MRSALSRHVAITTTMLILVAAAGCARPAAGPGGTPADLGTSDGPTAQAATGTGAGVAAGSAAADGSGPWITVERGGCYRVLLDTDNSLRQLDEALVHRLIG